MKSVYYPAPSGSPENLLIMLPGVGIEAADFAARGMVAALQAQAPDVNITATQPDIELYLDGGIARALHQAVVAPALTRGCTRIWLLGISLGGMGALLYASKNLVNIEAVCLLAPFLGTRGTTAELLRAGGLAAWAPAGSAATDPEQELLLWLQAHIETHAAPRLYLGYGETDRFAASHKMLAALLPPAHVAATPGGHDWASWTALWHSLLARGIFATGRCNVQ